MDENVLELIPWRARTYMSINRLVSEYDSEILQFPIEFLDSLKLAGLPPHELNLKVGSVVMLLRNMNVVHGLLEGTRLMARKMYFNVLDLEIFGVESGRRVRLPRVDRSPADATMPFCLKRRQFPIRSVFCMTINEAQGQTLNKGRIYLLEPVFSHGQLYVAMSRARSSQHVRIQAKRTCQTA